MSATVTFVVCIVGSGILTIAGILAVGLRRGPSAGPIATEKTGRGN